jgi:hypothetical protein
MEGEDWIIQLPCGAHEAHTDVFHPTQTAPTRRTHEDGMESLNSEKQGRKQCSPNEESNKRRRIGLDVGLLRGRPILRDVLNDTIDLT